MKKAYRRLTFTFFMLAVATFAFGNLDSSECHGQTIKYIQKLDLSPLPFTDGNAYWNGVAKSDASFGVWKLKITMNETAKSSSNGIITISDPGWVVELKNIQTGQTLTKTFTGTVSALTGEVSMTSTDGDCLKGIVRSWWKVRGVAKGPNVIQGVITLKP